MKNENDLTISFLIFQVLRKMNWHSGTRIMPVCSKTWKFWPNRGFFMVFHEMKHFLQLFAKKLIKTQKHATLFEKYQVLAKSMIFHGFSRNEALFASFC